MVSGCLGSKTTSGSNPQVPAVLVDYYRTGGIAGFNDRLVIFDNGIALVSSKTTNSEIELNQTDIDSIIMLFDHAQFSHLEGNYSARPGSVDLIKYSISYENKTVNTEDTAMPPSLKPVIAELNRIVGMGTRNEQSSLLAANLPR
ncbi:MAG: hypothetical protein NTZ37_06745 [Methanoregula sp.]|jgi:hypothetical protein|nr:hypothetical protein [Methanoregula sp.]